MVKASVKVTSKVIANGQKQIIIQNLPKEVQGGAGKLFELSLEKIGKVILGDTHAIWESHQQTEAQKAAWNQLFGALSTRPESMFNVVVTEYRQISGASTGGVSLDITSLLNEGPVLFPEENETPLPEEEEEDQDREEEVAGEGE